MPEDYVHDIVPLSQVAPIRPHPSNIRHERRRRRGGQGSRDGGGKKRKREASSLSGKDRITIEHAVEKDMKGEAAQKRSQDKASTHESEHQVRHIDIRI